jgi:hypothetical protein
LTAVSPVDAVDAVDAANVGSLSDPSDLDGTTSANSYTVYERELGVLTKVQANDECERARGAQLDQALCTNECMVKRDATRQRKDGRTSVVNKATTTWPMR